MVLILVNVPKFLMYLISFLYSVTRGRDLSGMVLKGSVVWERLSVAEISGIVRGEQISALEERPG